MRVLVACEFSGIVRDAFQAKGHETWSSDLLPTENPGNHYQGNVLKVIKAKNWDLMIAHPPCTHLSVSGARWWKNKKKEQREAIDFFVSLWNARERMKVCIENPIGIMSTVFGKPNQIIQPWQFGHGETKATCLWLSGLPKLKPSEIVEGRKARIHHEPPGPDRWKNRSRTYQGIAEAMAQQWG